MKMVRLVINKPVIRHTKALRHHLFLDTDTQIEIIMTTSSRFMHITLNENDVPGAALLFKDIDLHSVIQLKRWLQCRGLKQMGNKTELIQR